MQSGDKVENALKIALVVITAAAAALGVQLNPAARPADVTDALRQEIAPLRDQVQRLADGQAQQGARLTRLEWIVAAPPPSATTATTLPTAVTP